MRKWGRWILLGVGLLVLVAGVWLWPVLRVLMSKGLPQGPEMRKYEGTSADNLKAIRTALMLYHDNEDKFPEANGWMDAIEKQLKTNDLTPEEAAKKLKNPATGEFGYAINDAAAGKYKGDLKDPKMVLVYESSGGRNQHGTPIAAKGQAIQLDGNLVRLKGN